MSEWMPIDTALKTIKLYSTYSDPARKYDCRWSKDVLLCNKNKDIRVGYWLTSKHLRGWRVYGSDNFEPVAWMPLPEPYKADKDCRDCVEWETCECGKKGHEKGTSIGYSTGECAHYKADKEDEK